MGLGACYSCIKYLMFAFNFLFWLLGCAILGVGIWIRVDPNFKQYVDSSESFNYLYTGAYILIFVGVKMMIIGFLGCCGAIRESQCMLATFFVFLVIIFSVLLSSGIWAILAKDTLKVSVTDTLKEAITTYRISDSSRHLMDNVQTNFQCCGANNGVSDWAEKPPTSCQLQFYGDPCHEKLFHYFANNLGIIAFVSIGIGGIMVLGMIFSMLLCCAIREAVS
jgi:CD9 antigen